MERGGSENVNTVLVNSVLGGSMQASCFSSEYSTHSSPSDLFTGGLVRSCMI